MEHTLKILNNIASDTKLDVILCLGGALNKKQELSWVLESRVKKAMELFQQHPESQLILTGGKSYLDKAAKVADAEAMFSYIRSHYEYEVSRIVLESKSSSTVEQLCKIKVEYAIPNSWQAIVIVTDEFHIMRTSVVADIVFGDGYKLYFVGAELNLAGKYREVIERLETGYYYTTLETLGKFRRGDHASVLAYDREYKAKMKQHVDQGGDRLKPVKIDK